MRKVRADHPPGVCSDPFFLTSVKALPVNFSAENADVFFHFFDQRNTHVVTRCFVGGAMAERAYTGEAYTKDHSIEELKREGQRELLSLATATSSSSFGGQGGVQARHHLQGH